jgi:hypothetical protein
MVCRRTGTVLPQSKNLYSKANASRSYVLVDNAMGDFIGLCVIVVLAHLVVSQPEGACGSQDYEGGK